MKELAVFGTKTGDWRKLAGLDWNQRKDLLEAWLRVIAASLALRRRGARPLERATGVEATGGSDVDDQALERAHAMARLVGVAAARSPLRARCLERSVALTGMLAKRGVPAVLRLGVRRSEGELEAHAWVECAGISLDPDHPGEEPFEPFPQGFTRRR